MAREHIVILDFGAQYTQLIARRVREAGVYSEILPHTVSAAELRRRAPCGLVLSGGPASVYAPGAPTIDPALLDLGVPVLGICYGMQLITALCGGQVERATEREYGRAELEVLEAEPLFNGLPARLEVWMSHGDRILDLPPGFRPLARTAGSPFAAVGDPQRRLFGVQFHPEVSHTPEGPGILSNFLRGVCGAQASWGPATFIEETVARIRRQAPQGRAICALSGGVDSAVAAALVQRALGDRLSCLFVDHGLLRQGEAQEVVQALSESLGLEVSRVEAGDRFLRRLAGVTDPEAKRKIIGEEFIRVFEEEARQLGPDVRYLVQGTLYPDVVESGSGVASVIKSHHNVGGLPPDMQFELIEPLRELFKDEVRRVGEELGLPATLIWRQPFPGPGLAIRLIGAVTEERLAILRQADAIVREEIAAAGLAREVWQYFCVLTDVASVGVMGDARSYGCTAVVRAVTSQDGMTADWARLPYDLLARVSARIVNEVPAINRVVYDITSKPPATIEWE